MTTESELLVPTPPSAVRREQVVGWLTALPALSGLGSVAYLFAGPRTPVTYLAGSLFLISSVATVAGGLARTRTGARADADRARLAYLRALCRTRAQLRDAGRRQHEELLLDAPPPHHLETLIAAGRLSERRRTDPDFGLVRLGTGAVQPATRLMTEPSPEDAEPASAAAHARFVDAHSLLPDAPLTLRLRDTAVLRLTGSSEAARELTRSLLMQAAALHSPEDLRIAVCATHPDSTDWAWIKWLPHARHATGTDDVGPLRLMTTGMSRLEQLLHDDHGRTDAPHLILVLDGGRLDGDGPVLNSVGGPNITVLDLGGVTRALVPRPVRELTVTRGQIRDTEGLVATPDRVPVALADSLARRLAGVRRRNSPRGPADDCSLPALLGVTQDTLRDLPHRTTAERLTTPLGIAEDGSTLTLDIKEAALNGTGPHGLLIGATGSGKSELLRALALGMVATHDSETLNLVLVDFKGGATFADLAGLPHVAAVITNLEQDLDQLDRMRDALSGELTRRQQLLLAAGNLSSTRDYERRREHDRRLAPLPALWIVVDEFSELLTHRPDFVELFEQLGRLGRSLGVHLLLASQRLDEGRLRGLESHLAYRIALRTFSEAESRTVIGVPDAHALPGEPGHGLLRTHTGEVHRFRAAYASAPIPSSDDAAEGALPPGGLVRPFTAAHRPPVHRSPGCATETPAAAERPTVLRAFVRQLAGHGRPAHRVWLPSFDRPATLDRVMPGLAVRPGRGFGCPPDSPPLTVPVGLVDQPFRQRRAPLTIDLSGDGGNVAIVGGPRSGTSTLLCTTLAALALRHTPAELQIYGLDLGGGALNSLANLPHVGAVAGRRDETTVERIVAQLESLVGTREAAAQGTSSDSGRRAHDPYGHVVLAVDGWQALRGELDDVAERLTRLAVTGLTHGVHLVLTARRWLDLRSELRDAVGTRLELKLGDALDSEIDRRAQEAVPAGRPGRGVTSAREQYLAALPSIDGLPGLNGLPGLDGLAEAHGLAGLARLVATVAAHWPDAGAPPVRTLPRAVTLDQLPLEPAPGRILLGVEGLGLTPVALDPLHHRGLLVLGGAGSGKTSLLRSVAGQVVAGRDPNRTKVVLIDPRRSLLGEFAGGTVLSYATTPAQIADTVAGLVAGLTKRMPGPAVTTDQLRDRSWWTGPEVYLLVDDHDLLGADGDPLAQLARFLPHARDVGLHVVLARRTGGRVRFGADPIVNALQELDQPVVVLGAAAEDGPQFGAPTGPHPPGRGTLVDARLGRLPIQLLRADR